MKYLMSSEGHDRKGNKALFIFSFYKDSLYQRNDFDLFGFKCGIKRII